MHHTMPPKLADQIASSHNVNKSESDRSEYRGVVLQNDLKVLVISDPSTDKSAASLCVQIGYMSDPRSIPGLAHFCEHMLFLGTKKYPQENHYNQFLSQHGGKSNAFTSTDHTCFYFDVSPEHFREAVEIFAQFFIDPLFDQNCTDREISAVEGENDKNVKQDRRRAQRLERFTSNPEHDFAKFSTGNRDTLYGIPKREGIDVRLALLDFHNKWYSANIMNLCLFGKESLDDLTSMAVEMFSCVPNKKITMPYWSEHPFTEKELRIQIKVVPIKDIRQMSLTFMMPDLRKYYKSQPTKYLSHLVGHEGEGSLYSYLKRKGWITSLSGGLQAGARGFAFFKIGMDLSPEGLDHTDEIATAVFQYLSLLKQQGPQRWVFDEMKNLGVMHFRFKSKENPIKYVGSLACRMNDTDWKDILSAEFVVEDYKPELITEMLAYFSPERVRISLVSKTFEANANLREKYYGVEYSIEEIPAEKIATWKSDELNAELRLPPPNEFIPTNFTLAPQNAKYNTTPCLIVDEPHTRIWFLQDKEYNLPKNAASFELRSPLVYQNPLNSCLSHLIVQCFKDANKEYFFSAEVAGCPYYLSRNVDGFILELRGFNEHQQTILEKIFERFLTLKIEPGRFEVMKDAYARKLRNFSAEQPYEHAVFFLHLTLAEKCFAHEQLLTALENDCTWERCEEFARDVFKKFYIEALIHGNMTCEEAKKMGETPRNVLKCQTFTYDETPNMRDYRIHDGESFQLFRTNEVHVTHAVYVYYQIGSLFTCDVQTEALNDLMCQILEEPSFKVLRTEEQLGYLVSGGRKETYGSFGIRVFVQSQKTPPEVLDRIEAFMNDYMRKLLDKMEEKNFNNYKQARVDRLLEKPKKLDDLSEFLFKEISQRTYMFNRKQLRAEVIAKLYKEDVVSFFRRYVAHGGIRMRQIVINVESLHCSMPNSPTAISPESPMSSPDPHAAGPSDVDWFKQQHGFFDGNPRYYPLALELEGIKMTMVGEPEKPALRVDRKGGKNEAGRPAPPKAVTVVASPTKR